MTAAERARRERRAQGLPDQLADPLVLDRLAALLAGAGDGRGPRLFPTAGPIDTSDAQPTVTKAGRRGGG